MAETPLAPANPLTSMPCILLDRGQILAPGPEGPVNVFDDRGRAIDLFDVIGGLAAQYPLAYLVDLGALAGHDPQLDYIQEASRDIRLWVDAGVRNADQAIDVIVAGAERATLSSARFRGPAELKRAWELSPNLIFEIEIWDGQMTAVDPRWETTDPKALSSTVRSLGPTDIILSFRGSGRDWSLASEVSRGGPTWLAGGIGPADALSISSSGATGAIYPLGDELVRWAKEAEGDAPSD